MVDGLLGDGRGGRVDGHRVDARGSHDVGGLLGGGHSGLLDGLDLGVGRVSDSLELVELGGELGDAGVLGRDVSLGGSELVGGANGQLLDGRTEIVALGGQRQGNSAQLGDFGLGGQFAHSVLNLGGAVKGHGLFHRVFLDFFHAGNNLGRVGDLNAKGLDRVTVGLVIVDELVHLDASV